MFTNRSSILIMTNTRLCLILLTVCSCTALAAEPGLRLTIPRAVTPPVPDGKLEAGEWDDAAATTGVISQFGRVAHPRQAIFWLTYDASNLYFACRSTCFPEERDGGVPPMWLDRDSSLVLGVDPQRDGRGTSPSHFLLRVNVNKQMQGQEIFWAIEGGGDGRDDVKLTFPHPRWTSGATVEQQIDNGVWVCEMRLPLSNLKAADMQDGEEWGLLLGRDYSAADQCALTLSSDWRFGDGNRHYGRAFYNNYRLEKEYARMTLGGKTPAVQLLDLGDVYGGHPAPTVTVKNTTDAPLQAVVRMEWTVAYGSGNQDPPQEYTLELQPGERKSHTFRAVTLPADETHVCRITVNGPGGVLLSQEIPIQPGWGEDRNASIPEPYFSGSHFGRQEDFNTPLMSTGYDPIANEFYGRFRLGNTKGADQFVRGEITIRRQVDGKKIATLPVEGEQPVIALQFHEFTWGIRSATVLEWVAPQDGVVDLRFKGAHWQPPEATSDGEAMQVWLFEHATGKARELIPRQVFNVPYQWAPMDADEVQVSAGDRIQFYYDLNIGEGCDHRCSANRVPGTA